MAEKGGKFLLRFKVCVKGGILAERLIKRNWRNKVEGDEGRTVERRCKDGKKEASKQRR